MRFEALPAKFGDSLLLTIPDQGAVRRMLIDGGPSGVYASALKAKLQSLKPAGGPLVLDAVMVSHVDDDHVVGLVELFTGIKASVDAHQPRAVRIEKLIHNSFEGLAKGSGHAAGGPVGPFASLSSGPDTDDLGEAAEIFASIENGAALRTLAKGLGIPINPDATPSGDIFRSAHPPMGFSVGQAKFVILGPLQGDIDKLRAEWAKWEAAQSKDAREAFAAYADKSVPNLSSIVALVDWQGRKMLLTGDARGDKTLKGLEASGLLAPHGKLELDILKLPHHGSIRNVDKDFFARLPARHYVASGDGKFGNPDRATLELIAEVRAASPDFTLHLTYSVDHIQQTHRKYREALHKTYTPAEHDIDDVVAHLKAMGATVTEGPVSIDL